jgi:4-hydroxyproline epimerase
MTAVRAIDSHTEGEPTRVIIEGAPDLTGPLPDRVRKLRDSHDDFRTGVVCEPRGWDAVVGALLVEPHDPSADAGVIFFNNVGYLGMCGHGTIGVVRTLQYLGRLTTGEVRIETPVGMVHAHMHEDGRVSVRNVRSYRYRTGVEVGGLVGEIAYGGNWFFLAPSPVPLDLEHLPQLMELTGEIRAELEQREIGGEGDGVIDHIELYGPARDPSNHARNFVLCPGLAYDRSPCGTGTSAKVACLAADGLLAPGELWRQESVIGSVFEASYQPSDGGVLPTITGRAFVTADAELVFEEHDPFRHGIR